MENPAEQSIDALEIINELIAMGLGDKVQHAADRVLLKMYKRALDEKAKAEAPQPNRATRRAESKGAKS